MQQNFVNKVKGIGLREQDFGSRSHFESVLMSRKYRKFGNGRFWTGP